MGCIASNYGSEDANATIDGLQFRMQQKCNLKRSYTSRLSSASSGVFSRATTPTRSSLNIRCGSPASNTTSTTTTTTTTRSITPKGKYQTNNKNKTKNLRLIKGIEMLSICDDFCEGVQIQQQQQQKDQQQQQLDNSFGYYSESISTGSSKSALRYTRDTSYERPASPAITHHTSCGNLEMEMYMMTHSQGLMAKTSSPMSQRRHANDNTFDVTTPMQQQQQQQPPPTASYMKWCNYLQSTPAYMVHNITNIPEAIAGHFCPSNFPAFVKLPTDDDDDDDDAEVSIAKRFKFDNVTHDIKVEIDGAAAAAIISTEL